MTATELIIAGSPFLTAPAAPSVAAQASGSLIAGGSEKKSLEHLHEAVEQGLGVGLDLLCLAETGVAPGRIDDARKTEETILILEPLPDLTPEMSEEKAQARRKLGGKRSKKK